MLKEDRLRTRTKETESKINEKRGNRSKYNKNENYVRFFLENKSS